MEDLPLAQGTLHELPSDMLTALSRSPEMRAAWNALTTLARNEWICWVTIVKKAETRAAHITRLQDDLLQGKRRPCCWPGCPHRREKAKKWFKKAL